MKIKTSELIGPALDWAVAKREGVALVDGCIFTKDPDDEQVVYSPSTNWSQGGPIIERDGIGFMETDAGSGEWEAYKWLNPDKHMPLILTGPTPLIAAMRCYVGSKLGDEVDVPKELKKS